MPQPARDRSSRPVPGSLDEADRWRRALARAVDRGLGPARPILLAVSLLVWVAFAAALAWTGYPTWRVGVVAGCLVAFLVEMSAAARRGRGLWPAERGPMPLLAMLGGAGATGGLGSPLLPGVLVYFTGVLIRRGWASGEARASFLTCTAGGLLMAFAPEAWTGPRVSDPIHRATVLAVVVVGMAVQADAMDRVVSAADRALRLLFRTREEAACHALERTAVLERMGSQLSHELKNPLGAIRVLAQISANGEVDGRVRKRLEVIQSEVDRMQEILQGYVSFSRPLDVFRPEAVVFGELVDEVLALLEGRAEEAGVGLARSGDASGRVDPGRLKEALVNLVANALEATAAGGSVEVEIEEDPEAVRLIVRDSGRGMDAETLARVGSPFFTTRERGTGLGVLLARSVFLQHGGTLGYESRVGAGTVVTGLLPRAVPEEEGRDGPSAAGR